jgi:hypothetical protein
VTSWDAQREERFDDSCATEGCPNRCMQDDEYCHWCREKIKMELNDEKD